VKQTKRLLSLEAGLLLFLAVLYINSRAMAPGTCEYGFTWPDKFEHLIAFFVLSLLLDFAIPGKPFNTLKVVLLLLYGAGIEFSQLLVPFRDCDTADFIADILGIILYPFSIPLLVRIPVLRSRWGREA